MAMKLEGGERLVLKSLLDLQGNSNDYVEDTRLAAATKMAVEDVRDWLEILEGKGFVERTRLTDGFSAYVTAKGKQALRLTEPIRSPKPTEASALVPPSPLSAACSPSPHPAKSRSPDVSEPSEIPIDVIAKWKRINFITFCKPVRLFYSFSHDDEPLRKELANHLSMLRRKNVIAEWHDRQIGAGEEWKGVIDKNLDEAHIFLLLVSSSFLGSDYCQDVETKRALERHERGDATVIPVILRACDWHEAPFGKLQALPRDGKPITSWTNRDEAFTDVAIGIRRVVETMEQQADKVRERWKILQNTQTRMFEILENTPTSTDSPRLERVRNRMFELWDKKFKGE
jgi:hypothetical protein